MTAREWGSIFREASRVKLGAEAPRAAPSDEASFGSSSGPSFGSSSGPSFGFSRDDIQAQQHTITNMTTGTSVGINGAKSKFTQDELLDWYALARQSTAFVSADVPLLMGIDDMYAQGVSLLRQLNLWAAKLASKSVEAPKLDYANLPVAPPPTPGPDAYGGWNQRTPVGGQISDALAKIPLPHIPWWGWALGGTLVLGAGITVLKASPLGMALRVLR